MRLYLDANKSEEREMCENLLGFYSVVVDRMMTMIKRLMMIDNFFFWCQKCDKNAETEMTRDFSQKKE